VRAVWLKIGRLAPPFVVALFLSSWRPGASPGLCLVKYIVNVIWAVARRMNPPAKLGGRGGGPVSALCPYEKEGGWGLIRSRHAGQPTIALAAALSAAFLQYGLTSPSMAKTRTPSTIQVRQQRIRAYLPQSGEQLPAKRAK
jgi:hypothetical protein